MAYNLEKRFLPPPKYYKFLDPGAYQADGGSINMTKYSKVPFLSTTPRVTQPGNKIWTHAIYNTYLQKKIPNISCMLSKKKRFNYEQYDVKYFEEFLCNCGLNDTCECPISVEKIEPIVCNAKTKRILFKGKTQLNINYKLDNTPKKQTYDSPPFYDAKVFESTAFYHGCKWSSRKAQRSISTNDDKPGPADYVLFEKPNEYDNCLELNRHFKRKHSKQLRFLEQIQQKDIDDDRPGPASYSPQLPKGTELTMLGPKAKRFQTTELDLRPGPCDYDITRSFDPPKIPDTLCHCKLKEPSCFGVKANRFKPLLEQGPSPASYNLKFQKCIVVHCPTTPFNSSEKRFKDIENDINLDDLETSPSHSSDDLVKCPDLTSSFKSRTIRFEILRKRTDQPSPADLPQSCLKVCRSKERQYSAPFYSSEGRFHPWHNWIPILGKQGTPGPGYYNNEKPKCYPAVTRGPLTRARRFNTCGFGTPAPNHYNINGSLFKTYNERLRNNALKHKETIWIPPAEHKQLTCKEKESLILRKSLKVLDSQDTITELSKTPNLSNIKETHKSKLLRCFLHNKQIPNCI